MVEMVIMVTMVIIIVIMIATDIMVVMVIMVATDIMVVMVVIIMVVMVGSRRLGSPPGDLALGPRSPPGQSGNLKVHVQKKHEGID